MNGFLKLQKSKATDELLQYPDGFMLLTQIALRAKREDEFSIDGLSAGQAFVGDYTKIGMTERRYRTAKQKLEKWGFATFQGTNKGTVATICNSMIYDINSVASDEQKDKPATNKRRSKDDQETTNKKDKNIRNKEIKNTNTPLTPQGETVGCENFDEDFSDQITCENTIVSLKDEKEKKSPPVAQLPPLSFDDFWNRYNHKEGDKKKARQKWDRLEPDVQRLIMEGVDAYQSSFPGTDKQYQPHPITFLNQGRWETESFKNPKLRSNTQNYGARTQKTPYPFPFSDKSDKDWGSL